jgi:5'-deoxynucleotidase YfbR-like HD superfamily hydrolase
MQRKINAEGLSEEWILGEIEKIKYTYGLNKVIRYNLNRDSEKLPTQSVAEHVYNMLVLAHYFRYLEDPEHRLDFEKITKMILMHDMGEIETGDIIMSEKTQQDNELEFSKLSNVMKNTPDFVKNNITTLFNEFESLDTLEGKFAKAIDKIESQFWFGIVCDLNMIKSQNTKEARIKNQEKRRGIYADCGFPIIAKFGEVIYQETVKNGILE